MRATLKPLLPAALAALLAACNGNDPDPAVIGPDPKPAGISGVLYLEDGKPAAGAVVRVFGVDHVPGPARAKRSAAQDLAFSTRTDSSGRYVIDSLDRGEYNILGEKDGRVSFRDSVFLSGSAREIDPDTLLDAGLVAGTVRLQPDHNPASVTVQALGTHLYANADEAGNFVLGPLAQGSYKLRVATTESQYTAWTGEVSVRAMRRDTLAAPIVPAFTGIPVVTGLTAAYDTLSGTVTLRWNPARYLHFQEYQVFRNRAEDLALPATPVAKVKDTVWRDSLPAGSDPRAPEYHYRVKVADRSDRVGNSFGYAAVRTPPAGLVTTRIDFDALNVTSGRDVGGAGVSIGDSLRITASFANPTRRIRKAEWFRAGGDEPIHRIEFLPPAREGAAAVALTAGDREGFEAFRVTFLDEAGTEWTEEFAVEVEEDRPLAGAGPDATVGRGKAFSLRPTFSDAIGMVVKVEWDIGARGRFVEVKGGDTTLTAPDSSFILPCILRVTDDDGLQSQDRVEVRVAPTWTKVDPAFSAGSQAPFWDHRLIVFRDKLWSVGGRSHRLSGNSLYSPNSYSSGDGLAWTPLDTTSLFTRRRGHETVVFNDRLWVLGGYQGVMTSWGPSDANGPSREAWCSADGSAWTLVSNGRMPALEGFRAAVFQDRIWLVGGIHADGTISRRAWSSADGNDWEEMQTASPPPATFGHALVAFGGKLWLIGGWDLDRRMNRSDIWVSSNGRDWDQASPDGRFSARNSHGVVATEKGLWLFGGAGDNAQRYFPEGPVYNDLWHSPDGKTWRKEEPIGPPAARSRFGMAAFAGKIRVMHGFSPSSPLGDSFILE